MSRGNFVLVGYRASANGLTYPVMVQPETVTGWNPDPGAPSPGVPRIRVRQSRRAYGIYVRRVVGEWVTTPPGYKVGGVVIVPVFTPEAFAALVEGEFLGYLPGGGFRVVSKNDESIR